jgi:hypothetical protein
LKLYYLSATIASRLASGVEGDRQPLLGPVEQEALAALQKRDQGVPMISKTDETNAADYIDDALESRLDHLDSLLAVSREDGDTLDQANVEALDIGAEYDDHELQDERGLAEAG